MNMIPIRQSQLDLQSVSSFFLMPESENIHRIANRFVVIQRHIAGIAEGDHQFTQFGKIRKRPANVGSCFQQQKLSFDGLTGPFGSFRGFDGKELPAVFQPFYCALCNNYSWHFGAVCSSPVPQVFSQERTSCPVK